MSKRIGLQLNKRFAPLAIAAIFSVFALTGCTIINAPADPHAGHMAMTEAGNSDYSAVDIMFAQMMIPHHEQAVEMSELAISRSQNIEVLELAEAIKGAQDPEIQQMKTWLKAAGAPASMGHDMHAMGMDGMLTPEQLNALAEATGTEFDRLFLEGMILHHEGAIQMARMITNSENPEVRALGEEIITSQRREIERMRELLSASG
jgi:uncharacterized protein (DUF305 family)